MASRSPATGPGRGRRDVDRGAEAAIPQAEAVPASDYGSGDARGLAILRGRALSDMRVAARLGTIAAASALMAVLQYGVLRLLPGAWAVLPRLLSRAVTRIAGVRVRVHGRPAGGATLYVSNHISWLDIPVLSGRLHASFIAKHEIAGWDGMGIMARRYRSVFVDRSRRHASSSQRDEVLARLSEGDSLILFAEGTSTDGTRVRPFKSALFAVAQELPDLAVQPVTIAYTRINGMPMTRATRPLIGWFGDMELPGHVWQMLGLGRVEAELRFHPPLRMRRAGSRKALAAQCEAAVARGLEASNRHREPAD